MTAPAIEITSLEKSYASSSTKALDGVSLTVPRGSFFGLLGPNGAGKSTMINILSGLVRKTSGRVEVCGHDLDRQPREVKQSLGVVPQELVLDPFFPVFEVLENTAGYYGITKSKRRTYEIIEAVGLSDKAHAPARSLSGGMRRRLLVAKALVHSPDVLILDEPTAGVDVELRQQLWAYVRELNAQGTTILLTTHYLEEAEELCDHIAVINKGTLVANDSKDNLMKTLDHKELIIQPCDPLQTIPKSLEKFEAKINEGGQLVVPYQSAKHSVEDILGVVKKANITIHDLSTKEADLEEVFRHLTAS